MEGRYGMIARKVVCRMTKREARAWAKARRTELDMAAVGRGMAQALVEKYARRMTPAQRQRFDALLSGGGQ